ncbi:membrane protein [Mycobacterium phage ScoobyDoobyDoo]|nr:membrane protein [Mycobacterium phage ScoobyDoobyDoo]
MKELRRSWPIIGISLVLWVGVVLFRTATGGLDVPRFVTILVSTGAMFTLGYYAARIRCAWDEEKKNK